jgi:hypothetical protein
MALADFEVVPYSEDSLRRALGDSHAVDYLREYLQDIQAASIVIEGRYVDRHYLGDFSSYYSRSFSTPSTQCQRLHFFDSDLSITKQALDTAYKDRQAREVSERLLNGHYLGFVVARPLSGARVGRTVLRTYPPDGSRRFLAIRPYRVNLGGLRLRIEGLAYQQQDGGAAVCASTALWSALQRVAFVAGHRTPTPSMITAASKSPFPASHGLSDIEMAAALSSLGYVADQFVPAENRALFRAKLIASLESNLPVVLSIERQLETGAGHVVTGHAVTVTGYRDGKTIASVPSPAPDRPPIPMQQAGASVIYVHDDNLGSHAHYELFDSKERDHSGYEVLKLRRGRSGQKLPSWWEVDEWTVVSALVPKPEKMRMPIDALFFDILDLRTLVDRVFTGVDITYSARFCSGVDYKAGLFGLPFDVADHAQAQQRLSLPRYVGVVSVSAATHLCDFVLDVSEVPRAPGKPTVLAIIAPGVRKNSIAHASLGVIGMYFECHVMCSL